MWTYRRMLKISWTDKISNIRVLQKLNKEKEIIVTVKIRKLEFLGHIMRNESRYLLLQKILQGKVHGKRGPGRRRISWLKNLRTWYNQTTSQLFRTAVNKVQIAIMIANIRNGYVRRGAPPPQETLLPSAVGRLGRGMAALLYLVEHSLGLASR
uniref:Uncharacterized protein n=2 Tax=Cacopsylla melanoneura TaxID=428564 RepID=A0A8D8MAZ5_9HEMI